MDCLQNTYQSILNTAGWRYVHCSSIVQAVLCYLLVLEISTSGSAEILRNNLTGSVRLKELKWSEFGDPFRVIVILVCVRSLVGKLKTGRKPKSDQNFE